MILSGALRGVEQRRQRGIVEIVDDVHNVPDIVKRCDLGGRQCAGDDDTCHACPSRGFDACRRILKHYAIFRA